MTDFDSVILRPFLGWLLMMAGIWHPYVVNINAANAAALGVMCTIAGIAVAVSDML